ncbi:2Fe-2S iron-sulfur cluster-binding protein [Candidatus Cyanaurora vandensis]|uniref:2Fe-2S iron-sulfur cluster-binding protein n=1 Tax=Candidatus Cyanaurora vandensis TaxID=2714958 RepID=UPI00257E14E3|nr:2Fe-2S iron-sulfur cluster-binding protein [Candidatus Cyanaurora vandensis]
MPTIKIGKQLLTCIEGSNLRQVLLDNKIPLYNGPTRVLNCQGLGTCGTCAVEVQGPLSAPSLQEKLRGPLLKGRRLACQAQVLGDIRVVKYGGLWGLGQDVVEI